MQYYHYFSTFLPQKPSILPPCLTHAPITEDSCTDSYVFAYDEPSGTALWHCPIAEATDYTITFCPTNGKAGSADENNNTAAEAGHQEVFHAH